MSTQEHPLYEAMAGSTVVDPSPSTLVERIRQPSWMRDALCREYPTVSYFPTRGERTEAKLVCQRCLVAEECLAYAMTFDPPAQGI